MDCLLTFNKNGTYSHRFEYRNRYHDYEIMFMQVFGVPEDCPETTVTQIAGDWKWDHSRRELTLHEKWQDEAKIDRKFVFKLNRGSLESIDSPRTHDIYLRLQPLRE